MPRNTPTCGTAVLIKTIRALVHPLAPKPTGVRPKIRYLAGIKAVLFDIYGTMLISAAGEISSGTETNKTREFMAAAQAVGWDVADTKTAVLFVAAWQQKIRALRHSLRREGITCPEINIEQVWREVLTLWHNKQQQGHRFGRDYIRRLAIEYECRVNPVWPMPGLGDVLPRLNAAGLILGIVSNAQFFTPLALAAFPETGWTRGLFDKTLCAWSYRWKEAKPSARMLKAILYRLSRYHDITPSETLVVGNDMRNDILPASRLGCQTALFAGDARSLRWRAEKPECRAVMPSLILTRMAQLPKALDKSM
ncbi:MAG: HAD family hydrolase [Verrucomicrobia bacterium]|nr:HAD family hydrolase [Verrucomicrobiota bacterium]MBU1734766.1 HAD family hydrolase [Verrucomicrobiota bacterium]MBU1857785.1 HAD family hydrolase [Verrucomicrobiota bacterium]